MPEYLAPGVFVEEVSFRSKTIEGVATSTTGFAGMTRYGPVCYTGGPLTCEPRLITSFTEFERVYGGLDPLLMEDGTERLPYLAHAARAFFDNGGKRLYVSRVYTRRDDGVDDDGTARSNTVLIDASPLRWKARWPGATGNVFVESRLVRSRDIAFDHDTFGVQARGVRAGGLVEIFLNPPADFEPPGNGEDDNQTVDVNDLAVVSVSPEGEQTFTGVGGVVNPNPGDVILQVQLSVRVTVDGERSDEYGELGVSPLHKRYVGKILQLDDPEDEDAIVFLDWIAGADAAEPARLAAALVNDLNPRLIDGHDGAVPIPADLQGSPSDPDDPTQKATGLEALAEVEDVAIVALPDAGAYEDEVNAQTASGSLISHAERFRRIAVVDGQQGSSINEIRTFRGRFDSTHAAIYHPWIEILDPTERPAQGAPPRRLLLPPSGFVCGIYARNDTERGVHKAPANEVVRGLTRFESNINTGRQEVLNPEGINAMRFFEGRGYRVWGARTMSSDPEWKYVNVRRLFNFIESSIDRGTQWAVFEPNNSRLWGNIRRTVEDFLLLLWKDGALLGDTPEQAYFVRCDRTTMTQNDIDNGRLICLIGIAPTKPAEFVIFRIGQWTADAAV